MREFDGETVAVGVVVRDAVRDGVRVFVAVLDGEFVGVSDAGKFGVGVIDGSGVVVVDGDERAQPVNTTEPESPGVLKAVERPTYEIVPNVAILAFTKEEPPPPPEG